MLNPFEEIRDQLDMTTVAATYGLTVERGGMVKCPFHDDRHASAKLYPARMHCFACSRSWDAVGLIGEMFGLKPIDAARKLSDDFNLGLFPDKPLMAQERRRAAEDAKQRERDNARIAAFESWCDDSLKTILWYLHYLEDIKETKAPKGMNDEFSEESCRALHELSTIEYLWEILAFGVFEEKALLYKHWRGKIADITNFRKACNAARSA